MVLADDAFPRGGLTSDGERIYGLSGSGVYWMDRDGGGITQATRFDGGNICDQGTLSFAVGPGFVVWAWSATEWDIATQTCLDTISTIERVPLDGGAPQVITTTAGTLGAMAADATHVYWAGPDHVSRAPLDGGATEVLLDEVRPLSMVLADGLFVKDDRALAILRVDPDTGASSVVTRLGIEPPSGSLLVDAGAVYWIAGSRIMRGGRDGSEPEVLAELDTSPATFALDDDRLLFSLEAASVDYIEWSLWQVSASGSADPERISLYGGPVIALDADYLFLGTQQQILRFAKDADLPLDPPGDPDQFHPPFL